MDALFDAAKQLIDRKDTRVVSFDMFDTLVVRPLVSNTTVISLLSLSILKEYQIDVEAARIAAEKILNTPYATTKMIWYCVADRLGFSYSLADIFAEKEFELEKKLLFPRELGKKIFDYAVSKGKRIIIVSDMHFSSKQLTELLSKCGFYHISKVYVSCEQKAVKREGNLFDIVLSSEEYILPSEILHIGDSRKADVLAPQSRGICSMHLPKDIRILSERFPIEKFLLPIGNNLYADIIYGFALSRLSQYMSERLDTKPLVTYTHLVVWPMLVHVVLQILLSAYIQESGKYQKVFFAARDGHLTKKAYEILSENFTDCLASHYLLTSRVACHILLENHYYEGMDASFVPCNCSLKDYITSTVFNSALQKQILNNLTEADLQVSIKGNVDACRSILSGYEDRLEFLHREKKEATIKYYSAAFGQSDSVLIVDCGFSGTISDYLTKGFGGAKRFDKVFFWETEKNKRSDLLNGTITYTAFREKKGHALAPTVESLFSELTGSCLGFLNDPSGAVVPIHEQQWQPEQMVSDIQFVQDLAVELVRLFNDCYGHFLHLLVPQRLPTVMDFAHYFSMTEMLSTASMFDKIVFKEPFMPHCEPDSLGKLILRRNAKGRSPRK